MAPLGAIDILDCSGRLAFLERQSDSWDRFSGDFDAQRDAVSLPSHPQSSSPTDLLLLPSSSPSYSVSFGLNICLSSKYLSITRRVLRCFTHHKTPFYRSHFVSFSGFCLSFSLSQCLSYWQCLCLSWTASVCFVYHAIVSANCFSSNWNLVL